MTDPNLEHLADQLRIVQNKSVSKWIPMQSLEVACSQINTRCHLAILQQPYLDMIIDRTKYIESRFSKNRVAPYGIVQEGDVLVLKKSSGPIMALARVGQVEYFENLARGDLETYVENRADGLQISSDWLEKKRNSNYISFFHIQAVRRIPDTPLQKTDRRPWVVLTWTEND